MRLGFVASFCLAFVFFSNYGMASSSLRSAAASKEKEEKGNAGHATTPSIYDCLQAASGEDECRAAFGVGGCVWCAEPIYGLCVTPSLAAKLGNLPLFTCDSVAAESTKENEAKYGNVATTTIETI